MEFLHSVSFCLRSHRLEGTELGALSIPEKT